jgi:hypothetical protein
MPMKRLTLVFLVASLAACASTPQQRFASEVAGAKQADQPLLVYMLYTGNNYAGDNNKPTILPYVRLGFINTGDQAIARVDFQFEAYRNSRPVWDEQGRPFLATVTATGPVAPGADLDMQTPDAVFMTDRLIACAQLIGLQVDYTDGSSATVPSNQVKAYQTHQLRVDCGR